MSYEDLGPGTSRYESHPEPLLFSTAEKAEEVFSHFFRRGNFNVNSIDDQVYFLTTEDTRMYAQEVLNQTKKLADILLGDAGVSENDVVTRGILFGYYIGKNTFPRVDSINSTLQDEQPFITLQFVSPEVAADMLNEYGKDGMDNLGSDSGVVRNILCSGEWSSLEQWTQAQRTLVETAVGIGLYVYSVADVARLRRKYDTDRDALKAAVKDPKKIDWDTAMAKLIESIE